MYRFCIMAAQLYMYNILTGDLEGQLHYDESLHVGCHQYY